MKIHFGRYPRDYTKERIQRIHIDKFDVWNLDNTLAMIIHPCLVMLKESKNGAPNVDDEDVPEELRSTSAPPKENEYDTDEHHFKRWDYILDEMIWAFYQHTIDWEEQFGSGEFDIEWKDCEDHPGYKEMTHGPNHTYVYDREAAAQHQERMNNGRRLFAKYYFGLWD